MKNPEQQPRERLLKVLRDKKDHSFGVVGLFASLAPQISCEFHQSNDPGFFDYDDVSDRVRKGRIRQSGSDIFPDTESDIEKQFFYLQYDLRKRNLAKILEHELNIDQVMLELGSGLLDKSGCSFLSSSVRRELSSRIMHCDINEEIANKNKEVCPRAKFKQSDILHLTDDYPSNSIDVILGLNVLDTLSKNDLQNTLKQCTGILKNNGKIIHLMNIEPYVHAFYRNSIHEETFSVPILLNGVNRKIVSLGKEEYQDHIRDLFIENQTYDEDEIILLDYLASLSALQQERLWTGLLTTEYQPYINDIALKMEQFGKVIDPFESYCSTLKGSLEAAGFDHIEEDDEESSQNIDATHLPALSQKRIISGPKGVQIVPDTSLPEQTVLVVIETHVIKAVKAKP